MDQNALQELLKICKETGGRYIVVENGKPSFVLMDFQEYKKIFYKKDLNLSREDLLEKINKRIALWHDAEKEKEADGILEKEKSESEEARYYYDLRDKLDLD